MDMGEPKGFGKLGNTIPRIKCNVYVIDMRDGNFLEIPHVPASVAETYGTSWETIDIRNSTEPYMGYNASGPRTVNVSFQLHDDYLSMGVLGAVKFLTALQYPEYLGSLVIVPKVMALIGKVKVVGVCTSVTVNWEKPIREGHYIMATVSMSFVSSGRSSPSMSEVDGGYYYAG